MDCWHLTSPLGSTTLADLKAPALCRSAARRLIVPGFSLSQEFGELRLKNAELVVPRVAHDPEVKAAFLLVIPLCRAECFEPLYFGFEVVGLQVKVHAFSLETLSSPVFCRRIRTSESGRRS
jgi:hypothetical protein